MKRNRKLIMLIYPRQKRTMVKDHLALEAECCCDANILPCEMWTSSVERLLMNGREAESLLKSLVPRERRGLRIVEVPL